jgi:hypothetical protein
MQVLLEVLSRGKLIDDREAECVQQLVVALLELLDFDPVGFVAVVDGVAEREADRT